MTEESLAQLAGHDPDAQVQLAALLERYRREGIPGLRAAVRDLESVYPSEVDALVVEAVLQLSEARSPRITRAAWAREEERAEIEREAGGGGA